MDVVHLFSGAEEGMRKAGRGRGRGRGAGRGRGHGPSEKSDRHENEGEGRGSCRREGNDEDRRSGRKGDGKERRNGMMEEEEKKFRSQLLEDCSVDSLQTSSFAADIPPVPSAIVSNDTAQETAITLERLQ